MGCFNLHLSNPTSSSVPYRSFRQKSARLTRLWSCTGSQNSTPLFETRTRSRRLDRSVNDTQNGKGATQKRRIGGSTRALVRLPQLSPCFPIQFRFSQFN